MTPPQPRILWLDLARSLALVGMIVFHFNYDLAMFGLIPAEQVTGGFLRGLAVVVAASFIGLAGVSLQVAQGAGLRAAPFVRRLALLVSAAGVISLLTYLWLPGSFIFFGILHSIALCSVLGLAFLRMPFWVTGLAALIVLWLPTVYEHVLFDRLWLQWTGLGTFVPLTLDYEPIFPWFAAFLAGMTFAKLTQKTPLMKRSNGTPLTRALAWPGRHSLWVYLAHQPILIAVLWLVLQVI